MEIWFLEQENLEPMRVNGLLKIKVGLVDKNGTERGG